MPNNDLHFATPTSESKGNLVHYTLDGVTKQQSLKKGNYFDGKASRSLQIPQNWFIVKADQSVPFEDVGNFEADEPFSVSFWIRRRAFVHR